MALLHMEDFYNLDRTQAGALYAVGGDPQMAASRFPGTGKSFGMRFLGSSATRTIPARPEIILGFAFTANGLADVQLVNFLAGSTTHIAIGRKADGKLSIAIGATTVATSTLGLFRNGWNYVEVRAKLHATTGYVEVRAQGIVTPVVTFSGNTIASGTPTALDAYQFSCREGEYFGDVVCMDTTGSTFNDFLGEMKVVGSVATGPGSSTGLTPSTGANWSNTNEDVPSVTTYNTSAVSGARDTYTMADLAGNSVIAAVRADFYAHRTDTDPISMKMATKIGSTVYYGPPNALTSSMVLFSQTMETSPATSSPWTVSEFNGTEFGVEVV